MKTTSDTIKVRAHGVTITARPNAWGNWYGYIGCEYVALFLGDYNEQQDEATKWGAQIAQSSVLRSI
jgi:hypothetical protein